MTMQLALGRFQLGDVDLEALTHSFGAPLYVYDAAQMESQYLKLVIAFQSVKRLRIHYACKALTNLSVLRLFRKLGSGLDAVSIEEVEMGLLAGFSANDILYTPNCASFEEMQRAVALGVRVTIDNISTLEQFGAAYAGTVPICIRVNPHIMAGGNRKISVGHIDSKFGISVHQMPHVLSIVQALGLRVEGLHMHTGSDILDADVFLQGADILFHIAQSFPALDYIDFGSGFKVSYQDGGVATDVDSLGQKIGARFAEFCLSYGRDVALVFEPGKFLVSDAGVFLVRVNVVKMTPATMFVGVDSGLNHLIRPMFYDAYHHIENISNVGGKTRIYNVVGYICETDTFAINRQLAEVREGDILACKNAGAYAMSMASNYNSRFRPAEVLVAKGRAHLIRRRETMSDLLATQIEVPELA